MNNAKRFLPLLISLLIFISFGMIWAEGKQESAESAGPEKVKIAYVSNGPYTFWTYAHAGCIKAEQEYDVEVMFYKPPSATLEEQKRFIETAMAKGIDGLAISVIDPDNMTPFLDELAAEIPVVCFDSDAPDSNRLAYVGMSNYAAGRLAGQKIKEQLPGGGDIVIFVGRLDAQNAIERRQGIIDELQGKPYVAQYPGEMTPQGDPIKANKWIILDTRTDGGDESRAKGNAEDAIVKYPDLDLMIGLWSYNTPAIISAVQDAGKLGEIEIIGFDEEVVVLQAIKDGFASGTIVQNPYEYGRTSVELLYNIVKGMDAGIPDNQLVDVPARVITKDKVDEFMDTLEQQLAVGEFFELK